MLLGSEILRGLLVAGLCLLSLLPIHALPVGAWLAATYAVVLVVNSAGQFFNPARFATIGEIVHGEADRAKAFGLGQATNAAAAIIGPPLAAPLLVSAGIQWALLINALSYGVSFLAIRSIRFPATCAPIATTAVGAKKATWRAEFADGLRVFRQSRFLVALLTISCCAALGAGSINALNIFFLTDNLRVDSKLLGVMSMALGLGAVVGALASGRLVARIGARNLTWFGMISGGVLFGLYARQTSLVPAMILAVLFMIPVAAFNTGLSPLILAAAPTGYLGRVMAVTGPATMAGVDALGPAQRMAGQHETPIVQRDGRGRPHRTDRPALHRLRSPHRRCRSLCEPRAAGEHCGRCRRGCQSLGGGDSPGEFRPRQCGRCRLVTQSRHSRAGRQVSA